MLQKGVHFCKENQICKNMINLLSGIEKLKC